jgi:glycosyltransferase involved in cell wall biosynthesis
MASFSIIICTHNPKHELLQRLLNAVLQFDVSAPAHEVILVDNNSTPLLANNKTVQSFLANKRNTKLIVEKNPGLTSARITGINNAIHEWVIFFDDDNEPDINYLPKAEDVIQQYPQVGAWGPGTIEVEFFCQPNKWLHSNKAIFQQRNEQAIKFDWQQQWQPCYPYGTGMVIKKEVADEYARRVVNQRYTMSDRKGKSLSSGGDVQLVLTGIQLGYAAGVVPEMKLKHLIDQDKTEFKYLRKLIYGTSSSYIKAYNQVFSHNQLNPSAPGNLLILKLCWYYYKLYRSKKDSKVAMLSLINKLGEMNAGLIYNPKLRKPFLLKFFEFIFL